MTRKKAIASILGGAAIVVTGSVLLLTHNAEPKVMVTHGSHWKVVPPNYPNGYWNYPCVAGDTLYVSGNYTYMSFGGIHGTKDSPIVIMGDGNAIFKWNGIQGQGAGFNFQDCSNFHIVNVKVRNAPGVAFSIAGKSNSFEIDHSRVDTAFYFAFFKTDPKDHPNDSSYWSSLNMDDFYMHDDTLIYCHQDGLYLGNTDVDGKIYFTGYGGITFHSVPASVSNVRVARLYIRDVQRTAIQLSLAKTGNNYIDSCDIANCGFELNPQQGAGIALGKYTVVSEVAYNTIKNTFLNNFYSYATRIVKFNHNTCDSADYVYGHINPQANASVLLSATVSPTTFKIRTNTIGWNSSTAGIVVYGLSGIITDSGNVISRSGSFINNSAAQIAIK